jgi:hypothetical protein
MPQPDRPANPGPGGFFRMAGRALARLTGRRYLVRPHEAFECAAIVPNRD